MKSNPAENARSRIFLGAINIDLGVVASAPFDPHHFYSKIEGAYMPIQSSVRDMLRMILLNERL